MSNRCRHHACLCARAAELAAMGLLDQAVEVHRDLSLQVACRQPGRLPLGGVALRPGGPPRVAGRAFVRMIDRRAEWRARLAAFRAGGAS